MKQIIVMVVAGLMLGTAPLAQAWMGPADQSSAWNYEGSDDYDHVELNGTDVAALAVIGTALTWGSVSSTPVVGLAVASFATVGYGAWRTAQYRPEDSKRIVRENVARNAEARKYGTIYTLPAF